MTRHLLLRLVLVLCLPAALCAADGWSHLKVGMTADEAVAVLGNPLVRNQGKGFEVWIYDGRAEVLFYGGIIAWTAPGGIASTESTRESWQFYQAAPGQLVTPPPVRRAFLPRASQPVVVTPAAPASFRYQQRF